MEWQAKITLEQNGGRARIRPKNQFGRTIGWFFPVFNRALALI